MEWTPKEDLHIFPWDTSKTIKERIFLEHGPLVDIRKKGKEWEIIDWDLLLGSFMIDTPLMDVLREFPKEISNQVLEKHLKRLWLAGELDEEQWQNLFRYEMNLKKMEYETFVEKMRAQETKDEQLLSQAKHFLSISKKMQAIKPYEHLKWEPGQQENRFTIHDTRSLGQLFRDATFQDSPIILIILKQGEKMFVKTPRVKNPEVTELLKEKKDKFPNLGDGLHFFLPQTEPVYLYPADSNHYYLEILSFDDLFVNSFFSNLQITPGNIINKKDIGMKGQFVFPNSFLDFPLFQDACMNDPVISSFWFIDEFKQVNFEATLKVTFTPYLRELLDVEPKPFDFTMKNLHRQAGYLTQVQLESPIPNKNIELFFEIADRLMNRFFHIRDELLGEYQHLLPDVVPSMFEKQKKAIMKNVKAKRPDYFLKYPRLFVSGVYSIKCQRQYQPVLITEEEAMTIDPTRWILFPPRPIAEFKPEYYYCENKIAPYAGISKVKRGESALNFVPCCKKKVSVDSTVDNLPKLRLYGEDEETDGEGDEFSAKKKDKGYKIEKEKLIKQPGQLASQLPPSLLRLLLAYNPYAEYFRMGVRLNKNSFLNSILQMHESKGKQNLQSVEEIRDAMSGDPAIVQACIQENPGISLIKIQEDLGNPDVYFDPRRFLRAVEIYFNLEIVVFSKGIKSNDISLLKTNTLRSHTSNVDYPPLIFILEHFGGKMDILAGSYPHCEIISFRPFNEPDLRFEFKGSQVSNLLEDIYFRFDGIRPVLPFDVKQANILLEYLDSQSPDGLGKIRLLHFLYKGVRLSATVSPLPVIPNVPFSNPDQQEVLIDSKVIEFLQRFHSWKKIQFRDPTDTIVYWTVSQPKMFYKYDQNENLELTFKLRLPAQRKEQILQNLDRLPIIINQNVFRLGTSREDWLTEEIYAEKRSRCLQWITRHLFSKYLTDIDFVEKSMDPDLLLEGFRKRHCVIQDTRPSYENLNQLDTFLSNGKISIPSLEFWKKLSFSLKWHLFYKPKELMLFHKEHRENQVFFEKLPDYIFSDFQHFYCDFSYLKEAYEKSIESEYELQTIPLENLKTNGFWYNPKQSPFPFPSLVMVCPSLDKALNIAVSYVEKGFLPLDPQDEQIITRLPFEHYNWEEHKWVWQKGEGQEKIFTFKRKDDYLLLLRLLPDL